MARRLPLAALVLAALLAAPAALAAEAGTGNKVGVGVAITPDAFVGLETIDVYLPIALSPVVRLEPEFGLRTASFTGGSNTLVTVGSGLFYVIKGSVPSVDLYAGGRLRLTFDNRSAGGASSTGTDFYITGAFGGEYYLASKFSLGLEAQLGFRSLSAETSGTSSETGAYTNGLAFLRVYF